MGADVAALKRASDLLEAWAKEVGYNAMVEDTNPHADKGIKLYAASLMAFAAQARLRACELRSSALCAEAAGDADNMSDSQEKTK